MWSNDRTAVLGDLMSAPERDGSTAELDYGETVTRETVTRETVTRPRVTTYTLLGVTRQGPERGHEAACRGEFTSHHHQTGHGYPLLYSRARGKKDERVEKLIERV